LIVLCELAQKRELVRMKFQANLHGAKIKDGDLAGSNQETGTPGDPNSYAHLSKEERKRLTQKQLSNHKKWAEEKTRMV